MAATASMPVQESCRRTLGNLRQTKACNLSMNQVQDLLDWREVHHCPPSTITYTPNRGFAVWEIKPSTNPKTAI